MFLKQKGKHLSESGTLGLSCESQQKQIFSTVLFSMQWDLMGGY